MDVDSLGSITLGGFYVVLGSDGGDEIGVLYGGSNKSVRVHQSSICLSIFTVGASGR